MSSRRPENGTPVWLILITTAGVVATVIIGLWAWPKSCELSVSNLYTGHYRGFGLDHGNGLFGRSFFLVSLPPTNPDHGLTHIDFSGPGWNSFRGTYLDGMLREEGVCWVDINGGANDPSPDIHRVESGKYYDPDGELVSEIQKGTGVQTYFDPNGNRLWELELKNSERKRHTLWHNNGQLLTEKIYLDGREHGDFINYYSSGKKQRTGAYFRGKRTGTWIEYKEDGSIDHVEQYPAAEAGEE